MSEVLKDINKVWDRLFDQKGFLNGEINFTLREFEIKRGDSEVDQLFKSIENITDIKETQINRLIEVVNEKVVDANQQLSEALKLCSQFADLEHKYLENTVLEETKNKRKDQWEKNMDDITSQYSKINADFEENEIETVQVYNDMERKLK